MAEIITQELKDKIMNLVYTDESGVKYISLGNCRLDFSKTYRFNGFTKKGINLSWRNGDTDIKVVGKIEDRGDDYALYTEGWNYIEHLKKQESQDAQELNKEYGVTE